MEGVLRLCWRRAASEAETQLIVAVEAVSVVIPERLASGSARKLGSWREEGGIAANDRSRRRLCRLPADRATMEENVDNHSCSHYAGVLLS